MSRVRTVGSIPRGDEFVALLGPRVEQQLPSRGDAGDAEARVLQAVAVPPKKNVGNGSELPDSAPLRLCDKAVRRSRRWGCGGRREQPLQSRRDAGDAEARVLQAVAVPQKRTLGMAPNSPTARLCASATKQFAVRRSPFAALRLRRPSGTATATKPLLFVVLTNEPQSVASPRD